MKIVKSFGQYLFLIGLIFNLLDVTLPLDYCQKNLCPRKFPHIGCNNNGEISIRCQMDGQLKTLNNHLRRAIVDKHNQIRNMIAKGVFLRFDPAAHMGTVLWNNELAKIAALSVVQCNKQKNTKVCLNTDKFKNVGQNLAITNWPISNETYTMRKIALEQIDTWFNENEDSTPADIYHFPSNGVNISQFTQLIQEKSTDVGCGILRQTYEGMHQQFLTCLYSYGNVPGKAVYTIDTEASSECKTGVNPTYEYLCSIREQYSDK